MQVAGATGGHAWPDPAAVPLSLYVHLPWCLRKCPYCDFNSHQLKDKVPEAEYLAALLADFRQSAALVDGRRIDTVFFGGGTPSLFSPAAIGSLLGAIQPWLAADAEITLEANPGAVDESRFRGFRAAGVNRLSLGVQSFDDDKLTTLGRIHGGEDARRAAELAARHFERFSLDLMYALPGQTPEQAAADVAVALASGAGHLSCYQLTIEPNTVFHSQPPQLPADDTAERIEQAVHGALGAAGFQRYEISNWAQPGQQCRHNLNYWLFGDYLGIGAGAHSKLTAAQGISRQARVRVPAGYMTRIAAGNAVAERRQLQPAELPLEFMMNALRLSGGFPLLLAQSRTGLGTGILHQVLQPAATRGLLQLGKDSVVPTSRGLRFLNETLRTLLPD